MWDPGFHFDEVRLADLPGHQRRFLFRQLLAGGTARRLAATDRRAGWIP